MAKAAEAGLGRRKPRLPFTASGMQKWWYPTFFVLFTIPYSQGMKWKRRVLCRLQRMALTLLLRLTAMDVVGHCKYSRSMSASEKRQVNLEMGHEAEEAEAEADGVDENDSSTSSTPLVKSEVGEWMTEALQSVKSSDDEE